MNPTFDAFLRSWPFEPWLLASLLLTAGVYLRGWLALHRRDARRWPCSRPVAFGAGLSALFLALASPIEPFASLLAASPHAAACVADDGRAAAALAGRSAVPACCWGCRDRSAPTGSPRSFAGRCFVEPSRRLTHPVSAWLLFTAATWFWHLPPIYELALRSDGWHYLQHVCFLGTALVVLVSRRSGRIRAGRAGRPGC